MNNIEAKSSGPKRVDWQAGGIVKCKRTEYRIVEQLSETERSEIYRLERLEEGKHERDLEILPHDLVVKRLKPDRVGVKDAFARFEREIFVLDRIHDSSVLTLYDWKDEDPDFYFFIEYADKRTLNDYLADPRDHHRLRPVEALEIALSICQGLEAAHRVGIIHRDIKPGNIFLFSQHDGSIRAKLADFGIARIPKRLMKECLTVVGTQIGTYSYMSPEQREGKMVGPRSDLYSWAIVFFEMLTGEFPTDSLKDPVTYYPTSAEFSKSFFVEKGIPSAFAEVLQKNLQQDPDLRYESAAELRRVLETIKNKTLKDIDQHLKVGEEHLRASEWQAARTEFEQGLGLCAWDRPNSLHDSGKSVYKLKMGRLYAQGMMHLAENQGQAATEALEQLYTIDPNYMDQDITTLLDLARTKQEHEEEYRILLQHREQGNWKEVYHLATSLETDYRTSPKSRSISESVSEIRKLALYARGQMLLESEPERAYRCLYGLYKRDRNYEDVAELCVQTAYRISKQADNLASVERQAEWLEKVVEIAPEHRDGHTQQQLDETRFHFSRELQEAGKLQEAAEQLTRIRRKTKEFEEAQPILSDIYVALGNQEYKEKQWRNALEWWDKALAISPELGGTLRWRIGVAKSARWYEVYQHLVTVISVVATVVACITAMLSMRATKLRPLPSPTPDPLTLCNGDFKDGFVCWERGGDLRSTVDCTEGQCVAVLGDPDYPCESNVPIGEAWIRQSFVVPDVMSPTLLLECQVLSYDLYVSDWDGPDYFYVAIDGKPLSGPYGNTEWNAPGCDQKPWDSKSKTLRLDLSAYRGQQVKISFHNVNGQNVDEDLGGRYNTWTYVRDVRIAESTDLH